MEGREAPTNVLRFQQLEAWHRLEFEAREHDVNAGRRLDVPECEVGSRKAIDIAAGRLQLGRQLLLHHPAGVDDHDMHALLLFSWIVSKRSVRIFREDVITGGRRSASKREGCSKGGTTFGDSDCGRKKMRVVPAAGSGGAACRHHKARRHPCSRVGEGVRVASAIQSGSRSGLEASQGPTCERGVNVTSFWGFHCRLARPSWQNCRRKSLKVMVVS